MRDSRGRSARGWARYRQVSENGSQHETRGREPGRRVVVERHQKARGVRGVRLLPTPPPPTAASGNIGRSLLCCLHVCVQTSVLIVCMFGLRVNRQNQTATGPERARDQRRQDREAAS